MALDENEYFRHREQAHDRNQKIHAVHQVQASEGQPRNSCLVVQSDHRDSQTDHGGQCGLDLVLGRQTSERAERKHVEGKIFSRAEQIRDAGEHRSEQHQSDCRKKSPDERSDS